MKLACSLFLFFALCLSHHHIFGEDLYHSTETISSPAYDFNSDGQKEEVKFVFSKQYDPGYFNAVSIEVYSNDSQKASLASKGQNLLAKYKIVDIDSSDRFSEIVISEVGPSDDYADYIFRYTGKELYQMGRIEGYDLKYDGSGILVGDCRGHVLCTWYHPCDYVVNAKGLLEQKPREFYEMGKRLRFKVKLKTSLLLQKSPTNKTIVKELSVGEELTLIGSDDKEWVLAEAISGLKGWFPVSAYGREAFDGLPMAD